MPIVADAAARVRADMTDFNRDLKQGGEKGVQTLGQQLKSVFSKKNLMVAGVAGGIALAGAITAGLASAAKALIDIERLNAQTDAAIRSTGGVANVTRKGVEDLAEGIESLTTIERESVQEGANLLLTFKNIRNEAGAGNDIFDQSTKALVDMSVAMGTDVKSGAIQLGKALNDPIKGIAALNRVGITFSDVQKDMITAMVEAGDVMGAQKIILAELESQFGGSAEAFANTTAGTIQRFQNDVGNMFESIIVGAVRVGDAFGTAWEGIDKTVLTTEDSMAQVHNAVATNMGGVVETVEQAGRRIREDWDETSRFIPQAVRDRWADTRAAAFQMAVEHAKGILDGQNQIKVAFEVLTQLQEEEQTKAQRIAYLQGILSDQSLADGLNDGRPGVSAAARALRAAAIAELAGLGVDAYTSGVNIGNELARGLNSRYGVVRDAAGRLSQAIEGQIGIRSEPKDHDSGLYGHMQWGPNLVKDITSGIYRELGTATNAAGALAAALVPGISMPATAMAAGMAGGVTNQWILNAGGVERVFTSRDDFMNALDDMGSFGDGRLTNG